MNDRLTSTLLIIPGPLAADGAALDRALERRLPSTRVGVAENSLATIVAAVRDQVVSGAERLVILPVSLPDFGEAPLTEAVREAGSRWPFLTLHAAPPISWLEWAACVQATALDTLARHGTAPSQAGVLLAGCRGPSPLANADLARLAHLVQETGAFARVEHAFLDGPRPDVREGLQVQARLGLRSVVVPWRLGSAEASARLAQQVNLIAHEHPLRASLAAAPLSHSRFLDLLVSHHQAALTTPAIVAPGGEKMRDETTRAATPTDTEEAELRELDSKINALLPPEYRGRYDEVRPESMGTASLQYRPDGTVAWDEIWTSFCDLALAGGPPHRGRLLEAVTAADALAEPEPYEAVVAELERGIQLVTGLPVVRSSVAGWVGVRCNSEEMAIWLMRAIIVENVMVRREGDVLYLPAGPKFTLKREIKNVITVIAKTTHYWSAHLTARPKGERES